MICSLSMSPLPFPITADQGASTVIGGKVSGRHRIPVTCPPSASRPGPPGTGTQAWRTDPPAIQGPSGPTLTASRQGEGTSHHHEIPVMRVHLPDHEHAAGRQQRRARPVHDPGQRPSRRHRADGVPRHGRAAGRTNRAHRTDLNAGSSSALYGVLADIEGAGLDLIEVRRLDNPTGRRSCPIQRSRWRSGRFALGNWRVHRAGFGAMQLAGDGVRSPATATTRSAVLRLAVADGVDDIDTAHTTGPASSTS